MGDVPQPTLELVGGQVAAGHDAGVTIEPATFKSLVETAHTWMGCCGPLSVTDVVSMCPNVPRVTQAMVEHVAHNMAEELKEAGLKFDGKLFDKYFVADVEPLADASGGEPEPTVAEVVQNSDIGALCASMAEILRERGDLTEQQVADDIPGREGYPSTEIPSLKVVRYIMQNNLDDLDNAGVEVFLGVFKLGSYED